MHPVGSLVRVRNVRVRITAVLGGCLREFLFSEVRQILLIFLSKHGGLRRHFRCIDFSVHEQRTCVETCIRDSGRR